ncbi:MAG: hypothetical protein IJH83_04755, partial [Coriobacteriales bacterium]|nr:hypothetical protein [Coriobacteriales bacterium]
MGDIEYLGGVGEGAFVRGNERGTTGATAGSGFPQLEPRTSDWDWRRKIDAASHVETPRSILRELARDE